MRATIKHWAFVLLATACLLVSTQAWANGNKEYLIKAAFIYNFTRYVTWSDVGGSSPANINICFAGNNDFGSATSVFMEGSNSGAQLKITELGKWNGSAAGCQILIVSPSETSSTHKILSSTKTLPILTVSDIDGFADAGGIVGFITENGKVRLVINNNAAAQAGLKIDAQLLEIAQKVIR